MADSIDIKVKNGMFSYWTFPYLGLAGLSISYQVSILPGGTPTYKQETNCTIQRCNIIHEQRWPFLHSLLQRFAETFITRLNKVQHLAQSPSLTNGILRFLLQWLRSNFWRVLKLTQRFYGVLIENLLSLQPLKTCRGFLIQKNNTKHNVTIVTPLVRRNKKK